MKHMTHFMRLLAVVAGSAIISLCINVADAGSIVTNGSFEEVLPPPGSFVTVPPYLAIPTGWDVLGAPNGNPTVTSIDDIGNYWTAADGVRSLDMNGMSYGVIGQTLKGLVAGGSYQLTFEMAGNPDNGPTIKTLEADIFKLTAGPPLTPFAPTNNTPGDPPTGNNGTPANFANAPSKAGLFAFDISGHTHSNMGWITDKMKFVAPSSDVYLQFTSRTLAPAGSYAISPWGPALDNVAVTPVPLPAAAGVGFSLLGGFGGLAALRKRMRRSPRIA